MVLSVLVKSENANEFKGRNLINSSMTAHTTTCNMAVASGELLHSSGSSVSAPCDPRGGMGRVGGSSRGRDIRVLMAVSHSVVQQN